MMTDSDRREDSEFRPRLVVLAGAGEANWQQMILLRPLSGMSKGIPSAIAVALNAAPAAAADVNNSGYGKSGRFTSSTSVWDRLGENQGGAHPTMERCSRRSCQDKRSC